MRRLVAGVAALTLGLTLLPAATGQVEVVAMPTTVADRVAVPLPTQARAQGGEAAPTVTEVVSAPMPFSMVGFELPDGVDELRVRTSPDGEDWSPWTTTERVEVEHGPDPGSVEAADDRSRGFAEPVWVEQARHFQVELPAGQAPAGGRLSAELIDSRGLSGGPVERRVVSRPAAAAGAHVHPPVISRSEWGADESASRSTQPADEVHMGVVHHTATSNDYTDAKAVMRAMHRYHTQTLGWADLGYNIVVDQEGNVYEGRAGGLENGIIGAHARGYNTGSFGVSVIGDFDQIRPPDAVIEAVSRVVAWQSTVHDIDPQGWTDQMDGSWQPTVLGHRDVGDSSCPGGHLHPLLDDVRARAADLGGGGSAPEEAADDGDEPEDGEEVDDEADGSDGEDGAEEVVPPETTITSGPSGTVEDDEATLAFSATGDVAFYECRRRDEWYPCASPRTFSDLEAGEHTFEVRAVDPEGDREQQPAARTWTVARPAPAFADVEGSVHEAGVGAVAAAGITEGFSDGTFRPGQAVTRGQMATFLLRALELEEAGDPGFADVEGSVHEAGVGAVAAAGITEGFPDGTFRPGQAVTRGQMATFLLRALDLEVP